MITRLGHKLWIVATLSLAVQGPQGNEQASASPVPSTPARLVKEDEKGQSVCRMFIHDDLLWETTTPQIDTYDCNAAGALAAIADVKIAYGSEHVAAKVMMIVDSKGELRLLDAHPPIAGWPHGRRYPVYLGVHAFPRVAVFRLIPGPGLGEQWWLFEIDSGARLRSIDVSAAIDAAVDEDHSRMLAIVGEYPMREMGAFAVLSVPVGNTIGSDRVKDERGTHLVVIDLDGSVRFARAAAPWGEWLFAPRIEQLDEGYRLLFDSGIGEPAHRNVVDFKKGAEGSWQVQAREAR